MKNIRHEIDPALVTAQIEKKVADHEKTRARFKAQEEQKILDWDQAKIDGSAERWTKPPKATDIADVDTMMDEWIEREWSYYAFVRVIQREDGFRLVYGDDDDDIVERGTGPFETFEKAQAWFLNAGR